MDHFWALDPAVCYMLIYLNRYSTCWTLLSHMYCTYIVIAVVKFTHPHTHTHTHTHSHTHTHPHTHTHSLTHTQIFWRHRSMLKSDGSHLCEKSKSLEFCRVYSCVISPLCTPFIPSFLEGGGGAGEVISVVFQIPNFVFPHDNEWWLEYSLLLFGV